MTQPKQEQKTGILTAIGSVLAAFFGVQSASNHQRDAQSGRAWLFIVIAAAMTILLVVAVWLGVRTLVAASGLNTAEKPISTVISAEPPTISNGEATTAPNRQLTNNLDSIEHRVAPCLSCHKDADLNTESGYVPRISGKPAGYLYNQLIHFREGHRRHAVMNEILNNLGNDYLWEMSRYFAARNADYPSPQPITDTAKFKRGEQLVNHGDGDIPACNSCHGKTLVGVLPSVPGLLGLPADYTMAQFSAWQTGSRQAAQPDCMSHVANQLSIGDQQAVAEWLASRKLPANLKPEPGKLPDGCGSLPTPPAKQPKSELNAGAYLTKIANCAGCHTAAGGSEMAGGRDIESPVGTFTSPNITKGGIGDWSNDDFYNALHNGQKPDGSSLYPACPFPSYTNISRAETDQIYDHLQSLPAIESPATEHELAFPYSVRALLKPWRTLKFNAAEYQANPEKSNDWNRGAYLVNGPGHCAECHSERGKLGAIETQKNQRGALIDDWHAGSFNGSAGVQNWSQQETIDWLTTGKNRHAVASGPMAQVIHNSLQHMTDADAAAMATYLRDLPVYQSEPVANFLRVPGHAATQQFANGQKIYQQQCSQCHGNNGEGSQAAIGLANNRTVLSATPINLIQLLMHGGYGPATRNDPSPFGMPPYQHQLSAQQAASVLTYIRNDWGNSAAAIAPKDVAKFAR